MLFAKALIWYSKAGFGLNHHDLYDDDLDQQVGDEDLEADEVSQIDIKSHIVQTLRESMSRDSARLLQLSTHLTEQEKSIFNKYLTSS